MTGCETSTSPNVVSGVLVEKMSCPGSVTSQAKQGLQSEHLARKNRIMQIKNPTSPEAEPAMDLALDLQNLSINEKPKVFDEDKAANRVSGFNHEKVELENRTRQTEKEEELEENGSLLDDHGENTEVVGIGDSIFDQNRMVPKGPCKPANNRGRSLAQPYLQPAARHTLISDRLMNGANVLENSASLEGVSYNNENIPFTVADYENRLQRKEHGIQGDIDLNYINFSDEDIFKITSALQFDLNSLEMSSSVSVSSQPHSPCSTDSAYFSSMRSPASETSCRNDSPSNSPNTVYSEWSPQDQYSPCGNDRWDDLEYHNSLQAEYVGSNLNLQTNSNSSLAELKPPSNISAGGNCGDVPNYNLPTYNISTPNLRDFAFNQTPLSNNTSPPYEPFVSYPTMPYENENYPANIPNIPLVENTCNSKSASLAETTNDMSSALPIKDSSQTEPYRNNTYAEMAAPAMGILSLVEPQTYPTEKKKTNTSPSQIGSNSQQAKAPQAILPSGRCEPKPRSSKGSSTRTLNQRLQLLMKPLTKEVVWKAVVLQPPEVFCAKNEYQQTTLMQLLLRTTRPQGFIERVYMKVVRMMNEKQADLLTCSDVNGHSALYQAAILHYDRPELAAFIAESYAKLGVDVNEVLKDGNTLLHCLAELGDEYGNVLLELLELSSNGKRLFNTNARNFRGDTCLHIAAKHHKDHHSTFNVADVLMKRGSDVTIQNEKGETPLHTAAKSEVCEPNYFRKLLEQPGAVNLQDENGNTPLHLLAINVNVNNIRKVEKVMEQLLTSAARMDIKNKMGRIPIMNVHQDCVEKIAALFQPKRR